MKKDADKKKKGKTDFDKEPQFFPSPQESQAGTLLFLHHIGSCRIFFGVGFSWEGDRSCGAFGDGEVPNPLVAFEFPFAPDGSRS